MTKIKKRFGSVVLGLLMALGVGVSIGASNTRGEIAEVMAADATYDAESVGTFTGSATSSGIWSANGGTTGANYYKLIKSAYISNSNAITDIDASVAPKLTINFRTVGGTSYKTILVQMFSDSTFETSISDVVTFEAFNGTTLADVSKTISFTNTSYSGDVYLRILSGSGSGSNGPGVAKITFNYKKTVVDEKDITDLQITDGLNEVKKEYKDGASFDPTGLVVTATYDDSTTENVTNDVVWSPNPLVGGMTSVTGTYKGKTVIVDGLVVEAPVYTLNGTIAGGTNAYAEFSSITQNNIEWKVRGNTTENPWRIGGKSLTNVDIPIYSQTSLNYNVTAIDVEFGNLDSLTVNSLTLSVHDTAADAASGDTAILSMTPTFKANSIVSVDMLSTPQSNKFYRMVLNVTVSVTKNKYLELKAIKFYGTSSTVPSLTVTNEPSDDELKVGDIGQFTCSTENATNPVVTWASASTTIISVLDDGTYEALATGKATISATLACDELSTPLVVTFDVVVNYGSVTIEEANTIANSLSGDTVTADYYLSITGYIVNLNGDSQATGKERMIVLSDKKESEEGGNQINVFGIYSSNALRDIAIINGTVTIKGKPAKYKGTVQLASPSYSNYTDDAIEFATMFNADLKTPCMDPSADNSASVSPVWSDLESLWEDVDSYAQAKLKAATTSDSDENIKNFAGLYDHIVNRYELSNFVGRTLTTSSLNRFVNRNESRDLTAFIVFASIVGIASIGGLFLIRKRRRAGR